MSKIKTLTSGLTAVALVGAIGFAYAQAHGTGTDAGCRLDLDTDVVDNHRDRTGAASRPQLTWRCALGC